MELLKDSMPIGEVSKDGIIANKTGMITIGIAIEHAPGPLPPEEYEAGHQVIVKAMGAFPAGTIFNYQEYYWHKEWQPARSEGLPSFLAAASDAHFSGRPYLENESYLFITMPAPDRGPATWGSSTLLRRSILPSTLTDQ